jgi:TatD DNase family protein
VLVDTHCHLNFRSFDEDRSQVIQRAREAGVERILNPGIDLSTSQQTVQLAVEIAEIYAAVGVHPNDAAGWTGDEINQLEILARHPKVVAVGEIGLDYYWEQTQPDIQVRAFEAQLDLAGRIGLPVVIHIRNKSARERDAAEDALAILTSWQRHLVGQGAPLANAPGVLHSFSDTVDAAEKAVEHHFLIGVTGPVTFKNAQVLQQVVQAVPLESLLIETDSPFLTPHPYRGQRNEPAHVRYVAERIADLRRIPVEAAMMTTSENAKRLFHW